MSGKGYFRSDDKFAALKVARAVSNIMGEEDLGYGTSSQKRPIVVMCIGTDRSTGDSLGPLVGDMLSKWKMADIHIFGTLDFPVHARNLEETLKRTPEIIINPIL